MKYQTGLSYRGKGGHKSSGLLLTSKARSCEVSDRTSSGLRRPGRVKYQTGLSYRSAIGEREDIGEREEV